MVWSAITGTARRPIAMATTNPMLNSFFIVPSFCYGCLIGKNNQKGWSIGTISETVGFHPVYYRKVDFFGKIVNDKTI
jgi:hypothetical protein